MAAADRAINMALRVVGINDVERDFKKVGDSGSQAFDRVGKAADRAAEKTSQVGKGGGLGGAGKGLEDLAKKGEQAAKGVGAANQAVEVLAPAAGRVVPVAEAAAAGLSGIGIAAGVAATGFGIVAVAAAGYYVGALAGVALLEEQERAFARFDAQLALTGNQTGLAGSAMKGLAADVQASTLQTEDAVLKATNALAAFPAITTAAFEAAIPVAARLADTLGTDVAGEAEKMGEILSAIATRDVDTLEKKISALSPALQEAILKMTESGNSAGATKVYIDALSAAAGDGPSGLATANDRLSKAWDGMLLNWARTSGVSGVVEGAVNKIIGLLDRLGGKADGAGARVRAALRQEGGVAETGGTFTVPQRSVLFTGANPRAGQTVRLPGAEDRAQAEAARQQASAQALAQRTLDRQLDTLKKTTAEKQKQTDIDFARTKYLAAGATAAEAERRAVAYATSAATARADAKLREPGALRSAARAADAAARAAEQARLRGIRNEDAFQSQSSQLDSQLLQAKRSNVTSASAIADLSRQQVNVEADKAADAINANVALKKYSRAQAEELLAKNESVRLEKIRTIDIAEAQRIARDAVAIGVAQLDNSAAILRTEAALADTASERRRVELKLLDIDYQKQEAALRAVTVANGASETDEAIAKLKLGVLDTLKAGEAAAIRLGTAGPLEAYFERLPRSIDQVVEAMQHLRVDELEALNQRTQQFADDFAGAFGRAAQNILDLKSPLAIVRGLVGDLAAQFQQEFIVRPFEDLVRRKAGAPLAERLVSDKIGGETLHGTASPLGLTAAQMNTAFGTTTQQLLAFSAALQTGTAAAGGVPASGVPLNLLPANDTDPISGLASEADRAAASLAQLPPVTAQFGQSLATALAMLSSGGAGGSAGLFGSLLKIGASAFGAGAFSGPVTSAGTSAVYGGTLGGIYHGGGRVGPGGATRTVSAADFHDAPRLHSGTLGTDEFRAILKRDEDVLTGAQSQALRGFLKGEGARRESAAPAIYSTNINFYGPIGPDARRTGTQIAAANQRAQARTARKGTA